MRREGNKKLRRRSRSRCDIGARTPFSRRRCGAQRVQAFSAQKGGFCLGTALPKIICVLQPGWFGWLWQHLKLHGSAARAVSCLGAIGSIDLASAAAYLIARPARSFEPHNLFSLQTPTRSLYLAIPIATNHHTAPIDRRTIDIDIEGANTTRRQGRNDSVPPCSLIAPYACHLHAAQMCCASVLIERLESG